MKKGVTIWNYKQKPTMEMAREFYEAGFDAISWHGRYFSEADDRGRDEIADFLNETKMYFTVHHRLPKAKDDDDYYKAFYVHMDRILNWQIKYGLLGGLTFDIYSEYESTLSYLADAIKMFRGTGVFLACEDVPLTQDVYDGFFKNFLTADDNFGILIDIGHMNIRMTQQNKRGHQDFIDVFNNLPLQLKEIHLHDNLGENDDHMYSGYGTLPHNSIAQGLKAINFDGVVSVEIIQREGWKVEDAIKYANMTHKALQDCWNL